ncbi:hypothetical protein EDD85DRAFT_866384 [Armillaria nabsnona]|nr:hypothetical protein EDD85DRAFT_866384 [Armillaria nabsnona]
MPGLVFLYFTLFLILAFPRFNLTNSVFTSLHNVLPHQRNLSGQTSPSPAPCALRTHHTEFSIPAPCLLRAQGPICGPSTIAYAPRILLYRIPINIHESYYSIPQQPFFPKRSRIQQRVRSSDKNKARQLRLTLHRVAISL